MQIFPKESVKENEKTYKKLQALLGAVDEEICGDVTTCSRD